jgi:WD40 repeat protein
LAGHSSAVTSVAFAPDGRLALSSSAAQAFRLWDVATGQTERIFRGHKGPILALAVSPDGRTALSGSGDGTLKLWDLEP